MVTAYARAAALFRGTTAGMTVADLARPVPTCPGWTVSDLVSHVADDHHRALDDAGVQADVADVLVAYEQHLLDHPGTDVRVVELTLHAWDLGQALERPVVLEQPVLDLLETFAMQAGEGLHVAGGHARLDPPAGADRAARVLAAFGRRA